MRERRARKGVERHAGERSAGARAGHEAAGAADERDAFNRLVAPYLDELTAAARREVGYRVAVSDLSADDLSPEELVGETLARAWRDRARKPALLPTRAWLLALLFRVAEDIVRKEAKFRQLGGVSLEERVPPEPVYDDDEEFWEWYQPDDLTRWEDIVAEPAALTPAQVVEAEERLQSATPRTRLVYLLHDVHQLTLGEVAQALGISVDEVHRRLVEARRRAGGRSGDEA